MAQFYGGTSLFHIPMSEQPSAPFRKDNNCQMPSSPKPDGAAFQYMPQHEVTKSMMTAFFREQYQYNMCVYREYFLQDYGTGKGRHYSDLLLYAICAMGSLAANDAQLSNTFSSQAQYLLYSSLDNPSLTTLQALVLLGQVEIGHGRNSKGWLLSGMASRLTHEMGLHLDPNNWNGAASAAELPVDKEILRRVYWATFAVDVQLSLYFGRPPALFPERSDVHNAIRLPYPAGWEILHNTYITKGVSTTTPREDGIAFVGSFLHRVELYKILHKMMTQVFENRHDNTNGILLVHATQRIQASLTKWASDLPSRLHWTQWSVGRIPACVLHLQLVF